MGMIMGRMMEDEEEHDFWWDRYDRWGLKVRLYAAAAGPGSDFATTCQIVWAVRMMRFFLCIVGLLANYNLAVAAERVNLPGSTSKPFKAPTILYVVGGILWTLVFLGFFCCVRILREECRGQKEEKDK